MLSFCYKLKTRLCNGNKDFVFGFGDRKSWLLRCVMGNCIHEDRTREAKERVMKNTIDGQYVVEPKGKSRKEQVKRDLEIMVVWTLK